MRRVNKMNLAGAGNQLGKTARRWPGAPKTMPIIHLFVFLADTRQIIAASPRFLG